MSFKSLVSTISQQRQEIKQILSQFPYFDLWDENVLTECCRLSSIVEFPPEQIIFESKKGSAQMTYFILDGICLIIRQFDISSKTFLGLRTSSKKKSRFMDPASSNLKPQIANYTSMLFQREEEPPCIKDSEVEILTSPTNMKNPEKSEATEKVNIFDSDHHLKILNECTNKFKKCIGVKERRHTSQHRTNSKILFVQTGILMRKACFGLDKLDEDYLIMSATRVRCLKIPRGFLLLHDSCNVWNRISLFHRLYLPRDENIFRYLQSEREWEKFKNEQTRKILSLKKVVSPTRFTEVPISIRLAAVSKP